MLESGYQGGVCSGGAVISAPGGGGSGLGGVSGPGVSASTGGVFSGRDSLVPGGVGGVCSRGGRYPSMH